MLLLTSAPINASNVMLSSNSLNLQTSLESKVLLLGNAPSFHSTLMLTLMKRGNNDHPWPSCNFWGFIIKPLL